MSETGVLHAGRKVLAIIQARTGSSRFPCKPLISLGGRPMLAHVIERMRHSRLTGEAIVATSVKRRDLPIVRLAAEMDTGVYCGVEEDPLERYYQAAGLFGADHVVRIKSDCPLIAPEVVDAAIKLHLEQGFDYTSNTLERTFPVGLDVEILSREALERVWQEADLLSEREHMTLYVAKHPEAFRIGQLKQTPDLSARRWTIDVAEDYEVLSAVFDRLYPGDPLFGIEAVLAFFAEHPELERVNAHIPADAGVRTSLANDRRVGSDRRRAGDRRQGRD